MDCHWVKKSDIILRVIIGTLAPHFDIHFANQQPGKAGNKLALHNAVKICAPFPPRPLTQSNCLIPRGGEGRPTRRPPS